VLLTWNGGVRHAVAAANAYGARALAEYEALGAAPDAERATTALRHF
jgi:hypothetical protein